MKALRFISAAILALALVSCEREPLETSATASLDITLEIPASSMGTTKADVGEIPAWETENAIHDLKIWVFNSSTKEKVASLELDSTNPADDFPQAGSVKRYALPVSWDFAYARPRPRVDIFVMANSSAFGSTLNEESTWTQVNDATFGSSSVFSTLSATSVVPDEGLPMSGVAKNKLVSGEEPSLKTATVKLERAVSKIRFYFCQMKTESNNPSDLEILTIDDITINGGLIPEKEYIFAESAPSVVTSAYETAPMVTAGTNPIASSETPELYSWGGEDGPTYEQILSDGVYVKEELTPNGVFYLRESDKPLTGTIHYTVTKGLEQRHGTKNFTMSQAGDFSRNHTWVLYGYYVSNRTLELSVNVLPWNKGDYNITFSTDALMVTQKFTVLDKTVASILPVSGMKDHYNVTLYSNQPASAYLYVATPENGKLQIIPTGEAGSENAFIVTPLKADIDPGNNNGRIDITIDRNPDYQGVHSGKSIVINFKAFTPDEEREIPGASECIDQVYHFILP